MILCLCCYFSVYSYSFPCFNNYNIRVKLLKISATRNGNLTVIRQVEYMEYSHLLHYDVKLISTVTFA